MGLTVMHSACVGTWEQLCGLKGWTRAGHHHVRGDGGPPRHGPPCHNRCELSHLHLMIPPPPSHSLSPSLYLSLSHSPSITHLSISPSLCVSLLCPRPDIVWVNKINSRANIERQHLTRRVLFTSYK